MNTREESDLLAYTKFSSTKNNYHEQPEVSCYSPSLINGLHLQPKKSTFYNQQHFFQMLKIETDARVEDDTFACVELISPATNQSLNNQFNHGIRCRKDKELTLIWRFYKRSTYMEKARLHLPVGKNCFKIVIDDNGSGLKKADAESVFPTFPGLHGNSEYPCKELENHKGIFFGESLPEFGKTFTII
jgi:hypothetical protein